MDDHSMTKNEWIMFNHDKKRFQSLEKSRFYCYCGHSVTINPPKDRVICTHCGHWVYRDKQKYFTERMKGILKNESTIK